MLERNQLSDSSAPARTFRLNKVRLLGVTALLAALGSAQAGNLTPGNIVVVRLGDGAAALTSAAQPVFLDEYAPTGVLVQSIALPTATSGSNHAVSNSGSATSEGFLSLSGDGQYLISVGYEAVPGTAGVVGSSVARVIARTDMSGNVDTSTALTDAYGGNNIRSGTSDDGTHFWTAGTAGGTAGGVRYVGNLGATTSTFLSSTVTNTRVVQVIGGQLYVTTGSGSFHGVNTVGTGLPTMSGETIALLPGFTPATGSAYDFFFADANTLYVADDSALASGGGIQKWALSAGAWALQYTLAPGIGCRGLSGTVVGGTSVLFATTADNRIVRVADTGAGSTFANVATGGTNMVFRGLRFLPNACNSVVDCNTNGLPDSCEIALGLADDTNGNGIPDTCETSPGTPYCFGDGSGTACPCDAGAAGNGCPNSSSTAGAHLTTSGVVSIAADTLTLSGSGMPATGTCLYFQGNAQISVVFGDGISCAGGGQVRLGTKTNVGGASAYPGVSDPSVSVRGGAVAGSVKNYQAVYRDAGNFCSPQTVNFTNAIHVTWAP